jgi:HEAT repeat protein
MNTRLEVQLGELNGDARESARAAGDAAIPILRKHLTSKTPEERALVLECFAEIEGEEAINALVKGLEDPDVNVRKKAIFLLHGFHSPLAIPGLRGLVSNSPDEWVRGNAALILGRLDDSDAIPILKKQLDEETNSEAAGQMRLSLARLEEGEAREQVLNRLSSENARERYNAIANLEYVNKARLMSHLLPLLQDTQEVMNVGTEPFPVWHRVCDRAVEAVSVLAGKPLPFSIGGRTYSPEEIQQAHDLIKQVIGPK